MHHPGFLTLGICGSILMTCWASSIAVPNNSTESKNSTKGRQEEAGGAGGELAGIGGQVSQIIKGVLTQNVGDIFQGSLPFIDDVEVQGGVGTIFESLTDPVNRVWAAGNKQALKYFGITEPTTANPNAVRNQTITINGTTYVIPVAEPPATPSTTSTTAKTTTELDTDTGDGDGDDDLNRGRY